MPTQLPIRFTAEILKSQAKGGWTYLTWPEAAAFFGTHGLVKIAGTIDGHTEENIQCNASSKAQWDLPRACCGINLLCQFDLLGKISKSLLMNGLQRLNKT